MSFHFPSTDPFPRAGFWPKWPKNKTETGYCEGCYGFFLEDQGYNLIECSLFGDVLINESPSGKSVLPPHKTDWEFPIEKFYASHVDNNRI